MNRKEVDNITYLYSDEIKFKTSRIAFEFSLPIDGKNTAEMIVLNELMSMSCREYPSIRLFSRKLSELYDTKVTTNLSQRGKLVVFEISFNYVASKYLPENIENEIIELIKEVIFNPNLDDETYLNNAIQKRVLEVEAIYDDKMQYAIKSMKEALDKKQEIFIDVNSTVEELKGLTVEKVKAMHQKLLDESNVTVILSSSDSENLVAKLSENLVFKHNEKFEALNKFELSTTEEFVSETQNLSQSKVVIGGRLDLDPSEFIKFQVFNGIYGGYTFSRLFTNIREKQSLAYAVGSSFDSFLNMFFIFVGTDNGDKDKSEEEMLKNILCALKDECAQLANGGVTEEEMFKCKKMIRNSLASAFDSQVGTHSIHYSHYLRGDNFDLDKFERDLESVSAEDVSLMAKKVVFNVTYLLRGDK